MNDNIKKNFSPAVRVIIIFGIISLLGDAVYESARSANSQYFELIGISAAQVGLVFGIGEFLGYFLRLISGIISDKSKKHWLFLFLGYGMLIFVPLIAFTSNWNILIVLILLERIGKAIRNPSKDTILSAVSENEVGIGFAFGLQEALDQIGAFIGPLIFTAVFYLTGKSTIAQYQLAYKLLIIPFVLLIVFLFYAYRIINSEGLIAESTKDGYKSEKLKDIFWIYTAFTFFASLGFVNFSTIGYHMKATNLLGDAGITLIYSLAMIVDAITAILIGKTYDGLKEKTGKKTGGILLLVIIPFISIFLAFFSLSDSVVAVVIGMALFGVVMGIHETIMRSAIADITPYNKRGTGYGVFNTGYGLALLLGASLMGYFYDINNIRLIIAFSISMELIALVLYFKMKKMIRV